jgi:hypothetical protein
LIDGEFRIGVQILHLAPRELPVGALTIGRNAPNGPDSYLDRCLPSITKEAGSSDEDWLRAELEFAHRRLPGSVL